jgi:hypothetical protein
MPGGVGKRRIRHLAVCCPIAMQREKLRRERRSFFIFAGLVVIETEMMVSSDARCAIVRLWPMTHC